MTKKFSELRARMSPDSQARAAAHVEAMLLEMQLQGLRKARSIPGLKSPVPTDSILTAQSLDEVFRLQ